MMTSRPREDRTLAPAGVVQPAGAAVPPAGRTPSTCAPVHADGTPDPLHAKQYRAIEVALPTGPDAEVSRRHRRSPRCCCFRLIPCRLMIPLGYLVMAVLTGRDRPHTPLPAVMTSFAPAVAEP